MAGEPCGSSSELNNFCEPKQTSCETEDIDSEHIWKCSSCSRKFDKTSLYRCVSCDATSVDSGGPESFYCVICVVGYHLRQKHEIVDHKSYKPAVCEEHDNICELFCCECSHVFCVECLGMHNGHKFQTVTEKAVEIRKSVFDLMTKHEELSKPIKHREDIFKQAVKMRQDLSESFSENNFLTTLRETFEKVVKSNGEHWRRMVKVSPNRYDVLCTSLLQDVVQQADNSSVRLKEMLQTSDGVCIREFLKSEQSFQTSKSKTNTIEEQNKNLKTYACSEWVSFESLLQHSIDNAFRAFVVPNIRNIPYDELSFRLFNPEMCSIEIDCKEVNIDDTSINTYCYYWVDGFVESKSYEGSFNYMVLRKPTSDTIETPNFSLLRVHPLNCCVKHIFVLLGFLAICTKENAFLVYSLRTTNFVYRSVLETDFIPLELVKFGENEFSFIVWNKIESQIQLLKTNGSSDVYLRCKEQPKLVRYCGDLNVFVDPNNDLTIYNETTHLKLLISRTQHGLSCIDNIKLTDKKTVWLFDYKYRLAVKIIFELEPSEPLKCSVDKVFKCGFPCDHIIQYMNILDNDVIAVCDHSEYFSAVIPSQIS